MKKAYYISILAVFVICLTAVLFYNINVVPRERISRQTVAVSAEVVQNGGKVNINTASREKLCELHGVGEKTADKIIAYREENGAFKDISELLKINGIKQKLFLQISEEITI